MPPYVYQEGYLAHMPSYVYQEGYIAHIPPYVCTTVVYTQYASLCVQRWYTPWYASLCTFVGGIHPGMPPCVPFLVCIPVMPPCV